MTRPRTSFENPQQFSKCPKDYHARLRNPLCMKTDTPKIVHSRTFKPKPTPPKPDPPKPDPPRPRPQPDPPRPRPKPDPPRPKPDPGDREDDGNLVEGILGTVGGAATAGAGVVARDVLKDAARRAGYQALRGTAAAELEGALGSLGGETAYAALATSAAEATAAEVGTAAAGYAAGGAVATSAAEAAAAEIGLEAAGATLVESGLIAAGSEGFLNPVADAVGLGLLAAGAGVIAYEAIANIFG